MNILITGANSGFGQLIVGDLLKAGHRVIGSMRDVAGRNSETASTLRALGAEIVEIDVTSDASVESGVAAALARTSAPMTSAVFSTSISSESSA